MTLRQNGRRTDPAVTAKAGVKSIRSSVKSAGDI
jgi:hypothetical protein